MCIVDDMDLVFVRESSVGSLLNIFFIHWLIGGHLIRYDQLSGPTVGILAQNSFKKSIAPHMPGVSPPPSPVGLNIDTDVKNWLLSHSVDQPPSILLVVILFGMNKQP